MNRNGQNNTASWLVNNLVIQLELETGQNIGALLYTTLPDFSPRTLILYLYFLLFIRFTVLAWETGCMQCIILLIHKIVRGNEIF